METLNNLFPSDQVRAAELIAMLIVQIRSANPGLNQHDIAGEIEVDPATLSRAKAGGRGSELPENKRKEVFTKLCQMYGYALVQESDGTLAIERRDNIGTDDLKMLAAKLALNLIDVSTSFDDDPYEEILTDHEGTKKTARRKDNERERFIAIIGAGASYVATKKHYPLATKGAEVIMNKLEGSYPSLKSLIDRELTRLEKVYSLNREDFETQLLALSKFLDKEVVDTIKELFGYKNIYSLTYEIIAHMLKHRLLDVVINYNFDEILDNAIEEEVSKGDFRYIYLDGHCPKEYNDLLVNRRLRNPIYIKPHGTISHGTSLRFTREAYFAIPSEITTLLKDVIEARVRFERTPQRLPVNFIIVGFSMKSAELNQILKEQLEKYPSDSLNFYFFDVNNRKEDFFKGWSDDMLKRVNAYFFKIDPSREDSLDDYWNKLWGEVNGHFEPKYSPVGIERHQIVGAIFNESKAYIESRIGNESAQQRYFEDRVLVEIVMSLLHSDGILNLRQLCEDRAGKYYLKYIEKGGKTSMKEFCKKLGLEPYKGYVSDTFVLNPADLFHQQEVCSILFDRLANTLSDDSRRNHLSKLSTRKQCIEWAAAIKRRNLLKINPQYEVIHNHIFSNVRHEQVLNTGLLWIYKYRLTFKAFEWDLMLSISERGRFLDKDINSLKEKSKRLELILASFDDDAFPNRPIDDLNNATEYKDLLLSKEFLRLPWWMHNQHMVIFMKRRPQKGKGSWQSKWELMMGYYYESRMLSQRVNPVMITNMDDLNTLLDIFTTYWYQARQYTMGDNRQINAMVSSKEELEAIKEELFALYEQ
jgi:hypothetical protein